MFNFKNEPMKDVKLKGKSFRCIRLVYPMAFFLTSSMRHPN